MVDVEEPPLQHIVQVKEEEQEMEGMEQDQHPTTTRGKFSCPFDGCEKSFTRPCRLQEHQYTHTGEVKLLETGFNCRDHLSAINVIKHI